MNMQYVITMHGGFAANAHIEVFLKARKLGPS